MRNIPEIQIHPREIELLKIMSKNMKRKYISKSNICNMDEVKARWARTTVYTMLDRMCRRGLLKQEDKMLCIVYSYDEIRKSKLAQFVKELYDGDVKAITSDLEKIL